MAPIFTLTAAVHSFRTWRISRLRQTRSCATCTSPNRASKISFCTTPAGACANELQSFYSDAGSRRARRTQEYCRAAFPDVFAAADVRIYFWPRDGGQRLHAAFLQEPAAARHHGA